MMLPLLAHLFFFHRPLLTPLRVSITFISFCVYELTRVALTNAVIDRILSRDPRRVIILGSGRRGSKAWKEIRTRFHGSVDMLGFIDTRSPDEMAPDVASRLLGGLDQLGEVLVSKVVDVMLVAMPLQSCYSQIQEAIHEAEAAGVEVLYLQDVFSSRVRSNASEDNVFRELQPRQESRIVSILAKRLLDIVVSSLALVVLSPVLLAVAIAVRFSSPGPVIFVQQRHGFRRRLFPMYKFRSMVQNAEARMHEVEAANEADGPIFKITNDPRVTKVGKFLRSTSLDELPQLVNVLKGDMSLVGPRPMSTRDVSLMSEAALMRRFSIRPGMTGLWQVSGRSSSGFAHWILMDGHYIDRWSFALDLKILARTVGVVLKRSGAV